MSIREKKSASLEVRVTPSQKRALQHRAIQEGRGISAVVRDAVSDYLSHSRKVVAKRSATLRLMGVFCLAALFASIGLSVPAQADTIKLQFDAHVVTAEDGFGEEGYSDDASFILHVHADKEDRTVAEVSAVNSPMRIEVKTSEIEGNRVRLDLIVFLDDEVLGKPILDVELGSRARIHLGLGENSYYALSILPTRID